MNAIIKTCSSRRQKGHCRTYALVTGVTLATVLGVPHTANAELASHDRLRAFASISDAELDSLRGGFRNARGLEIRFGVTKLNRTNGRLEDHTFFDFKGSKDGAGDTVINGKEREFAETLSGLKSPVLQKAVNPFSLIQNNLDNQLLQSISIVDIRIANLLTLHSNLSLSRWIAESVRDF